jgi:hypothetical protein
MSAQMGVYAYVYVYMHRHMDMSGKNLEKYIPSGRKTLSNEYYDCGRILFCLTSLKFLVFVE